MTLPWLLGIVAGAALSMWTIAALVRDDPATRGYLQAFTVIVALALMIAGFIRGLH